MASLPRGLGSVVALSIALSVVCAQAPQIQIGFQRDCSFLDCGIGRVLQDTCTCKCPESWDPATNCQQLINGPTLGRRWPDVAFTLPSAGMGRPCPPGFVGTSFRLESGSQVFDNYYTPARLRGDKRREVTMDVCSRISTKTDYNVFPDSGGFCLLKSKDVYCSKLFSARTFIDAPGLKVVPNKETVAEIETQDDTLKFVICCRQRRSRAYRDLGKPMKLPNSAPFRLIGTNRLTCPGVQGMRVYLGFLELMTTAKATLEQRGTKSKPFIQVSDDKMRIAMCHYEPPIYGCNQKAELNTYQNKLVFRTPGTYMGRQANKRCFFYIKSPPRNRMSISFPSVDMEPDDILQVSSNNAWETAKRINPTAPPALLRTSGEFLMVEWWASHTQSTRRGVTFEVQLTETPYSCYDVTSGGRDYTGDHAYSENYEPCMPWSEMKECRNFPVGAVGQIFDHFDHNKCRNYGMDGGAPWCYTSKNCIRRNCDVCNRRQVYDVMGNCAELATSTEFCTNSPFKTFCFKTCKLQRPTFQPTQCIYPEIPSDGHLLGEFQFYYLNGDRIKVMCNSNHTVVHEMMCQQGSWSKLSYACEGYPAVCEDRIDTCRELLSKNAMFCTTGATYRLARRYCMKTCGVCDTVTCKAPTSDTYRIASRTPSSARTGRPLRFTCKDDLFHKSGDLVRACGSDGNLLGEEPVCVAEIPEFFDVNVRDVYGKTASVKERLLYMLDYQAMRVPVDGVITTWYAYCGHPGTVHIFIFSKDENTFTHVTNDSIECETLGPNEYHLEPERQIQVKKSQIIAVLTDLPHVLSADNCRSYRTRPVRVPMRRVRDVPAAQAVTSFRRSTCLMPSLAYRVVTASAPEE